MADNNWPSGKPKPAKAVKKPALVKEGAIGREYLKSDDFNTIIVSQAEYDGTNGLVGSEDRDTASGSSKQELANRSIELRLAAMSFYPISQEEFTAQAVYAHAAMMGVTVSGEQIDVYGDKLGFPTNDNFYNRTPDGDNAPVYGNLNGEVKAADWPNNPAWISTEVPNYETLKKKSDAFLSKLQVNFKIIATRAKKNEWIRQRRITTKSGPEGAVLSFEDIFGSDPSSFRREKADSDIEKWPTAMNNGTNKGYDKTFQADFNKDINFFSAKAVPKAAPTTPVSNPPPQGEDTLGAKLTQLTKRWIPNIYTEEGVKPDHVAVSISKKLDENPAVSRLLMKPAYMTQFVMSMGKAYGTYFKDNVQFPAIVRRNKAKGYIMGLKRHLGGAEIDSIETNQNNRETTVKLKGSNSWVGTRVVFGGVTATNTQTSKDMSTFFVGVPFSVNRIEELAVVLNLDSTHVTFKVDASGSLGKLYDENNGPLADASRETLELSKTAALARLSTLEDRTVTSDEMMSASNATPTAKPVEIGADASAEYMNSKKPKTSTTGPLEALKNNLGTRRDAIAGGSSDGGWDDDD